MRALFPNVAETHGVVVRVSVSYLPEQSEPARGRWFSAYHVRLENEGAQTVPLLPRHWIISAGRGARPSVEGEGEVGEQPQIGNASCRESVCQYAYISLGAVPSKEHEKRSKEQ